MPGPFYPICYPLKPYRQPIPFPFRSKLSVILQQPLNAHFRPFPILYRHHALVVVLVHSIVSNRL